MRTATSKATEPAVQAVSLPPGQRSPVDSYAVQYSSGERDVFGSGPPTFTLDVSSPQHLRNLMQGGAYSLAMAFLKGEIRLEGDAVAAVRHFRRAAGNSFGARVRSILAKYGPWRFERLFQSRARASRNIRFHYDRSNDFYRQFLDDSMVYSCAYFEAPSRSLEEAQLAKLDLICRKLDLKPDDRFLDIGCGWGALLFHAATSYHVRATGCTLSRCQLEYAASEASRRGGGDCVRILDADYRTLDGTYDKIASVGMFEHIGRRRLRRYFEKVSSLLTADGLFLNHGVVRPQRVGDDADSLFLKRHVFPGGELVHLSDVILEAENVGLEVLDVENLRPHYALTCRAWVTKLQQREAECTRLVGSWAYRTWLLFLAASADSFEESQTEVHQVLLVKRSGHHFHHLTRDYIYA